MWNQHGTWIRHGNQLSLVLTHLCSYLHSWPSSLFSRPLLIQFICTCLSWTYMEAGDSEEVVFLLWPCTVYNPEPGHDRGTWQRRKYKEQAILLQFLLKWYLRRLHSKLCGYTAARRDRSAREGRKKVGHCLRKLHIINHTFLLGYISPLFNPQCTWNS